MDLDTSFFPSVDPRNCAVNARHVGSAMDAVALVQTSQISTAWASDVRGSRVGTNSWAT